MQFFDDPVAWRTHLAQGNARQARKRVSADVLFRDPDGRVLLVDPTYKPSWDLPGGMAEANEAPRAAARREIREELGFEPAVGRLLVVDWVAPHDPWDDLLAFIFDGGTLLDTSALKPDHEEINAAEFVSRLDAQRRLDDRVWRRLDSALRALETGATADLESK
jgi:8-oxo-dGTP diphosphatase